MKRIFAIMIAVAAIAVSCDPMGGAALVLESKDNVMAGSSSSEFDITFSSSMEWQAKTSADWIHVDKSSGLGITNDYNYLHVTLDANPGEEARSGSVTISSGDFAITVAVEQIISGGTITYNGVSHKIGSAQIWRYNQTYKYDYFCFLEDTFVLDEDGWIDSGVGVCVDVCTSVLKNKYGISDIYYGDFCEAYDPNGEEAGDWSYIDFIYLESEYDEDTNVLTFDMGANLQSAEIVLEPQSEDLGETDPCDIVVHYVGEARLFLNID